MRVKLLGALFLLHLERPLRVFIRIEMLLEDSTKVEKVLERAQNLCLSSHARDPYYLSSGHLAAQSP